MDALANKTKMVVVCGATATGKTELAFSLCAAFGGELIGADSMQIYKGLPVGTAAPLLQEHEGIPRHLIAFLSPAQTFSVADYVQTARDCAEKVALRGRLPVVCGGTGLYIESLVNGICFTHEKIEESILLEMEERWQRLGGEALLGQLAVLDAELAKRLHPNDKKRIVRALAESEQNGSTQADRNRRSRAVQSGPEALVVVLADEDRQCLYRRIERRVDTMMQRGLLDEARWVYENRHRFKTAVQAIGYKEFFPYFEKERALEDCVQTLKQATRRYAKRQITWFRNHRHDVWLCPEKDDTKKRVMESVSDFLSV